MSNTAQSVLDTARGEIGYSRWTDPNPGTKYGRWYAEKTGNAYYGQSGVPFCAMFVSWVFDKAGAKCAGIPEAYCPYIVSKAKAAGKAVAVAAARPGDVVLFDWDGGVSDHVGIVESNTGSTLVCIEGNTDGGKVARRTRACSTVCLVVRPDYDGAVPASAASLAVDGCAGPATIREWQAQMGTVQDGVISGQSHSNDAARPAVTVSYGKGGSQLVCAVQRKVGAASDGYWGKNTSRAIQSWLIKKGYSCGTCGADGIFGPDSVRALQRSLNAGAWR